jgi:hypothetical protein
MIPPSWFQGKVQYMNTHKHSSSPINNTTCTHAHTTPTMLSQMLAPALDPGDETQQSGDIIDDAPLFHNAV